jgi:TolB-like protein/DNA-binding winged helix-turn-helix (wHTH) protein
MSTSTLAAPLLRFGTFELNLRAGELRKRGVKLRLQGQPLQILAILAKSPGDLVTREELRTRIWPADTFVDFDHSLHNAIRRIREVLGDSAEKPRYVETLPRRGYRFIAAVEEVHSPRCTAVLSKDAVEQTATWVPTQRKLFAQVLITLCAWTVIGFSLSMAWQRFYAPHDVRPIRSIAVLPMDNFSGDPAQDYLADGMTEELITELSRIQSLGVTSRTSVMSYKGSQKRLPQIARELGVDGIVEGSVSKEGDQLRVTIQLLDGPNDRHIWSQDYQRELVDRLPMQREVAEAISRQIREQDTPQHRSRLAAAHSQDQKAAGVQ